MGEQVSGGKEKEEEKEGEERRWRFCQLECSRSGSGEKAVEGRKDRGRLGCVEGKRRGCKMKAGQKGKKKTDKHLAGDPPRLVRQQEGAHAGNLGRLALPAKRDLDGRIKRFTLRESAHAFRVGDRAWRREIVEGREVGGKGRPGVVKRRR